MQTSFYQRYPIGELKELLGNTSTGGQPASTNSPNDIRTRQQALAILSAYERKDRAGKPLPIEVSETERAKLTDIQLTKAQAVLLGTKGDRIPLQDLLWLTKAEITPRPAFVTAEMISLAAYLATGGMRVHERLDAAMRERNAAYVSALDAFAVLSKPIKPEITIHRNANAGGQKIIRMLAGIEMARTSGSPIFLTENEYGILRSGKFTFDFEPVLLPGEQRMRESVNRCIAHMYQTYLKPGDTPFQAVFAPEQMARVKDLMKSDTTAAWLLQTAEDTNTPIILCEYTAHAAGSIYGQFVHRYNQEQTTDGKGNVTYLAPTTIDYIMVFRNESNDFDIAVALSHEARHMWQYIQFPPSERLARSAIDKIIFALFMESDARAVEGKISWGMHKNTLQTGLREDTKPGQFRIAMDMSSPAAHSLPTRVRQATQSAFIHWLEGELNNPTGYLRGYVGYIMEKQGASEALIRSISDSKCLNEHFLMRVSQVGNAHYLDKAGVELVCKMMREKLPLALAKLKPAPNSGQHYKT